MWRWTEIDVTLRLVLTAPLFRIAVTQGKAIVEPDPMADDLAGKAVVRVVFGVSGRCHGGCLSWGALGP